MLGLIIPCVSGYFINRYIPNNSVGWFLLSIVVYSIIYCASVWFISMNRYEKELIIKPIIRLFRKGS